jgi:hypothetical protein
MPPSTDQPTADKPTADKPTADKPEDPWDDTRILPDFTTMSPVEFKRTLLGLPILRVLASAFSADFLFENKQLIMDSCPGSEEDYMVLAAKLTAKPAVTDTENTVANEIELVGEAFNLYPEPECECINFCGGGTSFVIPSAAFYTGAIERIIESLIVGPFVTHNANVLHMIELAVGHSLPCLREYIKTNPLPATINPIRIGNVGTGREVSKNWTTFKVRAICPDLMEKFVTAIADINASVLVPTLVTVLAEKENMSTVSANTVSNDGSVPEGALCIPVGVVGAIVGKCGCHVKRLISTLASVNRIEVVPIPRNPHSTHMIVVDSRVTVGDADVIRCHVQKIITNHVIHD